MIAAKLECAAKRSKVCGKICKIKILFVYLRTEMKQMNKEYKNNEEHIARYCKALAHPARVAIVRFLASQECCYFGDIHEVLPIAKATVSQHLTELKNAGLIQGEILPPKVKYCINKAAWAEAQGLIGSLMECYNPAKNCCK